MICMCQIHMEKIEREQNLMKLKKFVVFKQLWCRTAPLVCAVLSVIKWDLDNWLFNYKKAYCSPFMQEHSFYWWTEQLKCSCKYQYSGHWKNWIANQFYEQTGVYPPLSAEVHQPALNFLVTHICCNKSLVRTLPPWLLKCRPAPVKWNAEWTLLNFAVALCKEHPPNSSVYTSRSDPQLLLPIEDLRFGLIIALKYLSLPDHLTFCLMIQVQWHAEADKEQIKETSCTRWNQS